MARAGIENNSLRFFRKFVGIASTPFNTSVGFPLTSLALASCCHLVCLLKPETMLGAPLTAHFIVHCPALQVID